MLSDLTKNYQMKIESLSSLSNITKKLKLYNYSIRFIKKSLQYIWDIKDIDKEIYIYEELGLIYFHMCNISKANQFHNRSISFVY